MSAPINDGITRFAALFIRRPVLTIVVNALIVVAGLAAFGAIEVRELPDVDQPVITVSTEFEGASPEAVDRQVTSEVEGAVARVPGITSISSTSNLGTSRVTIEFSSSTDLNVAANDVRDAVSSILSRLPDDVDDPVIVKADADGDPIIRLVVLSPTLPIEDLTTLVNDRIADQVAAVEGVAAVTLSGDQEEQIFIDMRPNELAARGLSIGDVEAALSSAAQDQPAGALESNNQTLVVRADASLSTPEEFEALMLDERTQLSDVATVRFGPEEASSYLRINGENGIGIDVVRQAGSSTIAISQGVRAAVAELNATMPEDARILVTTDEATFIEGSIHEVQNTLILAIIIVVAVIYVFLLSMRATLIPALTIPIALIGVLAGVYLAGFSLNIITLLALVLATGMVVDDAIIVLENIVRRRAMGAEAQAAAALGTREVFFAVISTTATLAAVFVPISFLPGVAGGLFREFGFVLAISVTISSFIALTLVPMMASRLLGDPRPPGAAGRAVQRAGSWMEARYAAMLKGTLAYPLPVLAVAGLFAGIAFLTFQNLDTQLTPQEDRAVIFMGISAPQSASLAYTNAQMAHVEDVLQPYLDSGEATNLLSRISTSSAFLVMPLADWSLRERTQDEIVREIDAAFAEIPGIEARSIQPNSLGIRGGGRGLSFAIAGPDYDTLADTAEALQIAMTEDGRWGRVDLAFETTQPQLSIEIDRRAASDLGIDIGPIALAVQALLDGREIATTFVDDRQVPIRLVSTGQPVVDPSDMEGIFVQAGDGRMIPLSSFVTLVEEPIAPSLARENQSRAVSLTADLSTGLALQQGWAELQDFAVDHLGEGMRLVPLAETATLQETSSGLLLVFGFALAIVFLVLAAQFESFVSALIILLTVPFGLACAVFALAFFGESLNLYSQIGLLLLVGMMAKNGIIMVEFANQLRDQGRTVYEATMEAATIRLRPIAMTLISTVLGGVPLILSVGAGAEARISLGYVIVGGLGLATVATLFLTPLAYLALARFAAPVGEKADELDRQLARVAPMQEQG